RVGRRDDPRHLPHHPAHRGQLERDLVRREMTTEAKTLGRSYDRPASLDNPRSARRPRRGGFEMFAWVFMRLSGVALLILVLTRLTFMLMVDDGVHRINFAFVADRWTNPFWQIWDLLMLWLAMLHGGNGLRTVIGDYSRKDSTRFWLNTVLAVATVLILAVGSYVIFSFDPHLS